MKALSARVASVALVLLVAAPGPLGAVALARGRAPAGLARSRPAEALLCARGAGSRPVADEVDALVVRRGRPLNPERFTIPALLRGRDAAPVRALARVLCALPAPRGVMACPMDYGVDYTLAFTYVAEGVSRPAAPVTLDVTGCELVRGLGETRWAGARADLFALLGRAVGLAHATRATFAGSLTT